MPNLLGGAPAEAITVLINGSFGGPGAAGDVKAETTSIGAASTGGITAYIPDGDFSNGLPNIEVVPVVGTGPSRATITTSAPVNSCAGNQNTGTVICTDNLKGIYLINGNTLSQTLSSGGVNQKSFSGGNCTTCGVVVDSLHNRAVISIANNANSNPSPPPGPGAYQVLNLANNTLSGPITPVGTQSIAESFGLNTTTNMIMSANEDGFFDLIDVTNPASPIAYSLPGAPLRPSFDSSAIDTTGIVVAGGEDSGNILIGDLSQATFSTNPPIWNAPNQIENLSEFAPSFGYFSSGITGMSIAFGNNEVFLEDEEGTALAGAGIGVMKLPSTGGFGTPSILDWIVAHMPTTPNNASWNMPADPHGLVAARINLMISNGSVALGTAPKGIGFVVNDERTYLAVVDLDALLAGPRAQADAHQLDPNFQALENNLVAYVPVNASTQTNFIKNGDFNDGFGSYTTGVVSGSPLISINTSPVSCLPPVPPPQGNPFASLNVAGGAEGFFEQQLAVPNAAGQVVSFKSWGIISPVTVTVSVIPSSGPAQVLGSFTAPQIMNPNSSCSGTTPAIKTFSLNAFAGQTLTLRFEATSASAVARSRTSTTCSLGRGI